MRHITFDESTVLGEFARIAGETGMIKTASIEKQAADDPRVKVFLDTLQGGLNQLAADTNRVADRFDRIGVKAYADTIGKLSRTMTLQEAYPQAQKIIAPARTQKWSGGATVANHIVGVFNAAVNKLKTASADDGLVKEGQESDEIFEWLASGAPPEPKPEPKPKEEGIQLGQLVMGDPRKQKALRQIATTLVDWRSIKEGSTGKTLVNLGNWWNSYPKTSNALEDYNNIVSIIYNGIMNKYAKYPNIMADLNKFKAGADQITKSTSGQWALKQQNDDDDDDGKFANKQKDYIMVNAKDDSRKYYDVTGETGEQLVEKAHPGGGTYTELTHSKTDENLVETIVEQQKKDIEVARSVPKGTYAALVNLYNTLTKMGHEKHLGELKGVIKSIATAEDIAKHMLVSLADKLDALGYRKHADKVDGLSRALSEGTLKKKVAQEPYVDPGIAEYGGSMPGPWVGKTGPTGTTEPVPTGREYEPKPGLSGEKPRKKYKRGPGIRAFQVWFNQQIKDTPYERAGNTLIPDSIYGPKTKAADRLVTAHRYTDNRGKNYRGREAFARAMEKRRTIKDPELEPIPSRAPAGRGVYRSIAGKLQRKFKSLNLDDPKFKNLNDAIKSKVRDLYTVRDPRQLSAEIDKFVNSISGQDIIQSMNV